MNSEKLQITKKIKYLQSDEDIIGAYFQGKKYHIIII